jgi:hypothetical protein
MADNSDIEREHKTSKMKYHITTLERTIEHMIDALC